MVHNAERRPGHIALRGKAGNNSRERKTAFGVLRINGSVGSRVTEEVSGQPAVFIRSAEQSTIFLVDANHRQRRSLAGNRDDTALTHQNGVCGDAVHALNIVLLRRLRIGVFHTRRSRILAILHGIAESIPALQIGRNIHSHRCHHSSGIRADLFRLDLDNACQLVVAIRTFISVSKSHCIVGEVLVDLQAELVADDFSRIGSLQREIHFAAQHGRSLSTIDRHIRNRRQILVAFNQKSACLPQLVTRLVLCVCRDRMPAVLQRHTVHIVSAVVVRVGVVIRVIVHVNTVDIHAGSCCIDAAGVLVVHIHVVDEEAQAVGGHGHAVRNIQFLRAVIGLHLVDIRRIRIIHIGSVDKLEIVKIDGTRSPLAHLSCMDKHQAEGHTGQNGVRCVAVQLCLAVSPAFPPDAGVFIRPGRLIRPKELGLKGKVILTR